jgi:hypothetical protein
MAGPAGWDAGKMPAPPGDSQPRIEPKGLSYFFWSFFSRPVAGFKSSAAEFMQ